MTERPICIKCKEKPSDFTNRAEDMCSDCFLKFLRLKIRKQMSDLKVDYSEGAVEKHVLLPLSFGKGSIVLLDMMCDLLEAQKQINNGRQGFILHALHINDGSVADIDQRLQQVKEHFPQCDFQVINFDDLDLQSEPVSLVGHQSEDGREPESVNASGISEIRDALASRSSKQDFDLISKRRIVDSYCLDRGYQTVVWGLCMTALSELVISLTAKGRGPLIPDYVNPSPDRNPKIIYPIGDLLHSELDLYLEIKQISNISIGRPTIPATTKFQSLDELISQYFESVEEGFPAVVSTVTRTAMKLESPLTSEDSEHCDLCGDRIQKGSAKWLEAITVHAVEHLPENICYGCIVMVQGSNLEKVRLPRYTVDEVVNKYSI